MSDGAHLGVTAGRAIDTILGGKESPEEDEGMTPAQMRAYLEGPDETPAAGEGGAWYSESARRLARSVLAYLDAHPEHRDLPSDDDIDADAWRARNYRGKPRVTRKGLYTLVSKAGLEDTYGLTGFQVGWGVNAAKYAVGAPPSPNPALLEVRA